VGDKGDGERDWILPGIWFAGKIRLVVTKVAEGPWVDVVVYERVRWG
jgi:hypothetical protein